MMTMFDVVTPPCVTPIKNILFRARLEFLFLYGARSVLLKCQYFTEVYHVSRIIRTEHSAAAVSFIRLCCIVSLQDKTRNKTTSIFSFEYVRNIGPFFRANNPPTLIPSSLSPKSEVNF